jgi:hypothetical protein
MARGSCPKWPARRKVGMRFFQLFALLVVSLMVAASLGLSKAEYTKKEGKQCTYCHPAGKFKELTESGKYYAQYKTLEGYTEAGKR